MVVISYGTIRDFIKGQNYSVIEAFNKWYLTAQASNWGSLADIKQSYSSVDYVGNDRYVFNIMGNNYRLVALITFRVRTIYIRFVGTHADYDKINAPTI